MDEWSGKEIWMSTVPKFAGHFKDRLYGGVTIALQCLRNWFRWGVKFLYKNSLYLLETCHEKWKLQLVNGKGLQELRLFSRHWGMPANRDTSWLKWSINESRQTNEMSVGGGSISLQMSFILSQKCFWYFVVI